MISHHKAATSGLIMSVGLGDREGELDESVARNDQGYKYLVKLAQSVILRSSFPYKKIKGECHCTYLYLLYVTYRREAK